MLIPMKGFDKLTGLNRQNQAMNTYKRHRFPPDIISYTVWLYYRFNLSPSDIEDLRAEHGSSLAYIAPRAWSSHSPLFRNDPIPDLTRIWQACARIRTAMARTRLWPRTGRGFMPCLSGSG